jgi:hypothetical protein
MPSLNAFALTLAQAATPPVETAPTHSYGWVWFWIIIAVIAVLFIIGFSGRGSRPSPPRSV